MIETPAIESIKFIQNFWEKKLGLLFTLFIANVIYLNYIQVLITDFKFNIFLLLLINASIFLYWLLSTNRKILFFGRPVIKLAILIQCDDVSQESKIKDFVNSSIKSVKSRNNLEGVSLKLLPVNHMNSEKEIEDFVKSQSSFCDSVIMLKFRSGNNKKEDSYKIHISKIGFSSYANHDIEISKVIEGSNLNGIEDIRLRYINSNWDYLEKDNYNDKYTISDSISNIIIFYCGIFLLYSNKPIKALPFLKELFKKEDAKIHVANFSTSDQSIKVKGETLVAARLFTIIIEVYLNVAKHYYESGQYDLMFSTYKEAEVVLGLNKYSNYIFVALARYYYGENNIKKAKEYTVKMRSLTKNSTNVLLNEAFFYLIEENISRAAQKYNKLLDVDSEGLGSNYVEVRSFLINESSRYPHLIESFNLADCVMCKMIGVDINYSQLEEISNHFNDHLVNRLILKLKLQKKSIKKKRKTFKAKGKRKNK